MKSKLKNLIIIFITCCAFGNTVFVLGNVHADVYEGEGATPGGISTDCGGFINGFQGLCFCNEYGFCSNSSTFPMTCYLDNGGEYNGKEKCGYFGGGKSWRIFSMDSDGYVPVDNSKVLDKYIPVSTVKATCGEIGATHYVVYGWDRPYNRNNSSAWGGHYYAGRLTGPANRIGSTIQGADYNYAFLGGMAYTWDRIENMSASEMNAAGASQPYGLKVTDDVAEKLYKRYKRSIGKDDSMNIPNNVGYFCYGDNMAGTSFLGTSRVLKEDVSWNDSMVDAGTGVQLPLVAGYDFWRPSSAMESDYVANKTLVLNDCDPVSGCSAVFRHYMKRYSGSGESKYSVTKSVNGASSTVVGEVATDGLTNKGQAIRQDIVAMYPGQKVCETLNFYAKGDSGGTLSKRTSTTVCAVAVATVGSNINAKIKDENSSSAYTDWRSDYVYAKPGDKVEIEGAFEPLYQPMYNISLSNGKTIGRTFDDSNDPDWNNAFNIKIGDNCGSRFTSSIGNASKYGGTHKYLVQDGDVGQVKRAWAITNCEESAKNTPREVSLKYSDASGFTATVNTEPISDSVEMRVPYNFKNSVAINSNNGEVVYAGEEVDIEYELRVGGKYNSETSSSADDIYATKVPGAQWGLEVKYDDGEYVGLVSGGEDLDSNGKSLSQVVNVEDKPAGTHFCVRARLWPVNSGDDNNLDVGNFGNDPDYAEKCFTIAKKPSFQVWGGDIYAGGADTPIALKQMGDDKRAFGSWGELGVFTSGSNSVQSLASGAGLGYQEVFDGRPGGYKLDTGADYRFCDVSTLTFPEGVCNNVINSNSGVVSVASLVGAIKEKVSKDSSDIDSGLGLVLEGGAFYTWNNGVGGGLYESVGNITITKDITRENISYGLLESVPKTVIHGNNINIACGVEKIDAVLIADNNINTCSDSVDNPKNSRKYAGKRLTINGAMMAGNTIYFNRTYGAGPGNNSIEPAEIINYDSTWYAWNEGATTITPAADGSTTIVTSNLMVPVYTRELAPRY